LTGESRPHLRFITCGSVDDGKSTLIGRLLHDAGLLAEDQIAALRRDSGGAALDFSLLVDGLQAEREQGITIDVAYRYFATPRRSFIVADTPGHEQYTRNMATGASTAEAALILIDARRGVLTQTRRHAMIAHLLGIRSLILAVNKMDLVEWDRGAFARIVEDFRGFAEAAGMGMAQAVPVSALLGDNVVARGAASPWYDGPPLLELLETLEPPAVAQAPFRMAVQGVTRSGDVRLYQGQVASGTVRRGEAIAILPSGARSRIARIATFDGDLERAQAGQSVALALTDAVDCGRGDLLAAADAAPPVSDRIDATLIWMAGEPLIPGRAYWLKTGTQTVSASVGRVRHVLDVETAGTTPGRPLAMNEIGDCELVLDRAIPVIAYEENRTLGGLILIDRADNGTVAAGLVRRPSRYQPGRTSASRARRLAERLEARGRRCFVLDAAALARLNADLAPGAPERERRRGEVAAMMAAAGIVVLMPD
jgi:bifunctional enzyme CysN/CysC